MIAMKNTKGLSYSKIMNKTKEIQELLMTYNAIMAGQLKIDENVIGEKILKLADELGIDPEELGDLALHNFGDAS